MGMFDDLIPQQGGGQAPAPPSRGMFDDLIPTPRNNQPPGPHIIPLDNAPQTTQERQFANDLRQRGSQEYLDRMGFLPGQAFVQSMANTAGLNIPRRVGAQVRSFKTGNPAEQEYEFLKRIDDVASVAYPYQSAGGVVAGALGQAAALPVAPAATMVGRAFQGAKAGAALGGASELVDSGDPMQAARAAAIGGGVGAVAAPLAEKLVSGAVNAVGGAAQRVAGRVPVAPTTEDLAAASQAAYRAADDAGVVVKPEGVRSVANEIKQSLADEAYHPKNQPKLSNFLGELEKLSVGGASPGAPNIGVTLKGLETTRKMLRAARGSADPEERRMAAIATEKFDDYLANLSPSQIASGDIRQGAAALKEARSLWSSYRKADMVEEALTAAQDRAATAGSGGNVDNAIRQEFRKILQNRKKSAAFTEQEKAALARVVTGTGAQNTIRWLGKLSPHGDGLRFMLSLGAAGASGGASLPVSALGAGAKALADNATKKNVERLSEIIRARGLNIDPQDIIQEQGRSRLRNFFTSIGIDVERLASDMDTEE